MIEAIAICAFVCSILCIVFIITVICFVFTKYKFYMTVIHRFNKQYLNVLEVPVV
jgi:hypothetical protein